MAELRRTRWPLLLITSRLTHAPPHAHTHTTTRMQYKSNRRTRGTVTTNPRAEGRKDPKQHAEEERKNHGNNHQTHTNPNNGLAAKDIHGAFGESPRQRRLRAEAYQDFKRRSESYVIIHD